MQLSTIKCGSVKKWTSRSNSSCKLIWPKSPDWSDCKSNKTHLNQIYSRRKTSRSRVEDQQTQATYGVQSGNRTRTTLLVEGQYSHHCADTGPVYLHTCYRIFAELKLLTVIKKSKYLAAWLNLLFFLFFPS